MTRIRAILSSTALFSALSLLPKVLAVLKDMEVARRFGAMEALDVYLMALALIAIPISVIGLALQSTLIPALVNKSRDTAAGLMGGATKFALFLFFMALPVWLLLLPWALKVFYPNSPQETLSRLYTACLWLIPYYFLTGMNFLFYGALQAQKKFWPNALLPGLFPIAILISLWLVPSVDIRILLIGTTAGSLGEWIFLNLLIRKAHLLRWRETSGSGLLSVVLKAAPLAIAGIMAAISPLAEQLIAFRLGEGSVSLLHFGFKVPAALSSLLVLAVGTVVLPHFSELVGLGEWARWRKIFYQLALILVSVGLAISFVGIFLSEEIIRLLFERGAFRAYHTLQASEIMEMYLLQLPFLLLSSLAVRVLMALGRTGIVALVSVLQLFLVVLFAYSFSLPLGVKGVALGAAAASGFVAMVHFVTSIYLLRGNALAKNL